MLVFFVPAWMVLARTAFKWLRKLVGLLLELILLTLWVVWMAAVALAKGSVRVYRYLRNRRDPFYQTLRDIRNLRETKGRFRRGRTAA